MFTPEYADPRTRMDKNPWWTIMNGCVNVRLGRRGHSTEMLQPMNDKGQDRT